MCLLAMSLPAHYLCIEQIIHAFQVHVLIKISSNNFVLCHCGVVDIASSYNYNTGQTH